MRTVVLLAALLAAPLLAAAPASAHMVTCGATDVLCVATCNVHTGIGGHECRIVWPLAAESTHCHGDPAVVEACAWGSCFTFTVLGERRPWLDFC